MYKHRGHAINSQDPTVDVIIAVHNARRPIARAVRSVLGTVTPIRVTVVAHNVDRALIAANLGEVLDDPRVRLVDLHDAIHSPAGPMNYGLDLATGEYAALMGSDDEFAPGAIDAWVAIARAERADVVIAPAQEDNRPADPYPPVRRHRVGNLDGDRDRLSFRSAPLGLVSRVRFGDLRLAQGLGSGEDLPFVTHLWFSGASIAFDPSSPRYLIHTGGDDRVTFTARPVHEDFRFLDHIEHGSAWPSMRSAQRRALVVKLLRVQLFDAIAARINTEGIAEDDRQALVGVLMRLRSMSPAATSLLSLADHRAIRIALRKGAARATIDAALAARWRYGRPSTLITANPFLSLHRHAPFRTMAAGIRVRHAIESATATRGACRSSSC